MQRQYPDDQHPIEEVWIEEVTDLAEHIDEVNTVATEYLTGKTETEISNELALPRTRVVSLIKEWKSMAANSEAVRVRAREALAGADQHYSVLIKEAYDIAEEAKTQQALGQRTAALKLILDIEKSRLEMLQKAGLLENRELAEKLMETETKQKAILDIITEVVNDCPVCKPKVLGRMSGVGSEPVVMYDN